MREDEYPNDFMGRNNTTMMQDVLSGLQTIGHDAFPVVADGSMFERLLRGVDDGEIELVFNLSDDGYQQNAQFESQIPAFLDLIGVPYTGSDHLCLGTCLDKYRTKLLLRSQSIPTPNFFIVENAENGVPTTSDLTFPLIVKPSREDGSIGIRASSVVEDMDSLIVQCTKVIDRFHQPALVEEFVEGREFSVGILGRHDLQVLPISEIIFTMHPSDRTVVSYEGKWSQESDQYRSTMGQCPAMVEPTLENKLINLAKKSYGIMGVKDYGRIDYRVGEDGLPQILEVNPNPDISREGGLARMTSADGMDYLELLENVILSAYGPF